MFGSSGGQFVHLCQRDLYGSDQGVEADPSAGIPRTQAGHPTTKSLLSYPRAYNVIHGPEPFQCLLNTLHEPPPHRHQLLSAKQNHYKWNRWVHSAFTRNHNFHMVQSPRSVLSILPIPPQEKECPLWYHLWKQKSKKQYRMNNITPPIW